MARAIWNGTTIAESEDTVMVEGNHYFPMDAVKDEFLTESPSTSRCPWKGTASYFDVVVDGETNKGAAWVYHDPKAAATDIRGHVAFWRGVTVEA